VVALDLTGHGDSDHRDGYDLRQWAREVVAVAAAEDLGRPVVVGHSMGGWVAITVGVDHAELFSAAAYIDSPLVDASPEEDQLRHLRRPTRVYPTPEAAIGRFRTLPEQDVILPFIGEHVARTSLKPVEGGWTWKFDPEILGRVLPLRELLPRLRCPAALFACEHGMIDAAMAAEMARLVPGRMPVVDVPDAGHHPMLDQPLSLVTGLRTLLALWPAAANAG
jgi:pimeloyl-ACP methyl ester carboxylesterase